MDRQELVISMLEEEGQYVLADQFRALTADKATRRKSKIEAINIAADVRDKLEKLGKNLLSSKVGAGIIDMAELLDAEFDRLEDKIAKILTEYLEFKSNNQEEEPVTQPEPFNPPEEEIEDEEEVEDVEDVEDVEVEKINPEEETEEVKTEEE